MTLRRLMQEETNLSSHHWDLQREYSRRSGGGEWICENAYRGCAIGKAKQNATTEIEKLKPTELSSNDLVKEAAKIIYTVHDEIKDKNFELDLSWVGECSGGVHQMVPESLFQEAEAFAKQALEEADDIDDDVE
ncbi:20S proteasome subunit alpha 7 [Clonorchis sinensis]|uniref:20S proteasome subunit alpha 7 n=1 Tax=Clonorchis sinensis TaxID=79923 RepID=G7YQC9_CLOSI|nr:20S proteasome subunit alpha 7 [Clonorchis sinensis]